MYAVSVLKVLNLIQQSKEEQALSLLPENWKQTREKIERKESIDKVLDSLFVEMGPKQKVFTAKSLSKNNIKFVIDSALRRQDPNLACYLLKNSRESLTQKQKKGLRNVRDNNRLASEEIRHFRNLVPCFDE